MTGKGGMSAEVACFTMSSASVEFFKKNPPSIMLDDPACSGWNGSEVILSLQLFPGQGRQVAECAPGWHIPQDHQCLKNHRLFHIKKR